MSRDILHVSLRECRMVLERLILIERLDGGLVPALRDCALYSAMHHGGFDHVRDHIERLKAGIDAQMTLDEADGDIAVDCGGRHAWTVADTLLDLAVDRYRRGLPSAVRVRNVGDAAELAVIPYLAERYRLAARVDGDSLAVTGGAAPTALDQIRRHGLPVERTAWWRLFRRANDALAPESLASRRHAGPIMVDAEGRVIGRADEDETDLNLLTDPTLVAAGLTLSNGE